MSRHRSRAWVCAGHQFRCTALPTHGVASRVASTAYRLARTLLGKLALHNATANASTTRPHLFHLLSQGLVLLLQLRPHRHASATAAAVTPPVSWRHMGPHNGTHAVAHASAHAAGPRTFLYASDTISSCTLVCSASLRTASQPAWSGAASALSALLVGDAAALLRRRRQRGVSHFSHRYPRI